jgi:hypothetical protein
MEGSQSEELEELVPSAAAEQEADEAEGRQSEGAVAAALAAETAIEIERAPDAEELEMAHQLDQLSLSPGPDVDPSSPVSYYDEPEDFPSSMSSQSIQTQSPQASERLVWSFEKLFQVFPDFDKDGNLARERTTGALCG